MAEYTSSIPFDWRLYRQDISGSIAHATMLAKQGIISGEEAAIISQGLESIREEIAQGKFEFKSELEDIHMAIEARLMEKVGEVGGKLHMARSRNDQVALDLRLFAKEAISETLVKLRELQSALVSLAEYKDFSSLFDDDVYSITVETSLAARDVIGGYRPEAGGKGISCG